MLFAGEIRCCHVWAHSKPLRAHVNREPRTATNIKWDDGSSQMQNAKASKTMRKIPIELNIFHTSGFWMDELARINYHKINKYLTVEHTKTEKKKRTVQKKQKEFCLLSRTSLATMSWYTAQRHPPRNRRWSFRKWFEIVPDLSRFVCNCDEVANWLRFPHSICIN